MKKLIVAVAMLASALVTIAPASGAGAPGDIRYEIGWVKPSSDVPSSATDIDDVLRLGVISHIRPGAYVRVAMYKVDPRATSGPSRDIAQALRAKVHVHAADPSLPDTKAVVIVDASEVRKDTGRWSAPLRQLYWATTAGGGSFWVCPQLDGASLHAGPGGCLDGWSNEPEWNDGGVDDEPSMNHAKFVTVANPRLPDDPGASDYRSAVTQSSANWTNKALTDNGNDLVAVYNDQVLHRGYATIFQRMKRCARRLTVPDADSDGVPDWGAAAVVGAASDPSGCAAAPYSVDPSMTGSTNRVYGFPRDDTPYHPIFEDLPNDCEHLDVAMWRWTPALQDFVTRFRLLADQGCAVRVIVNGNERVANEQVVDSLTRFSTAPPIEAPGSIEVRCGHVHNKFAIVDSVAPADDVLYTGSSNWGEHWTHNDDALLRVVDPQTVAEYRSLYSSDLWTTAHPCGWSS